MNYEEIIKAMDDYDKLTPAEVQEAIRPIIKSHNVEDISEKIGVAVGSVYQWNKRHYVEVGMKPKFEHYVRIMALGVNDSYVKTITNRKTGERKAILTKEEREVKRREYAKRYHQEVIKKKKHKVTEDCNERL